MDRGQPESDRFGPPRSAFTLIEMLVAIGIVLVLMGIVFGVGRAVLARTLVSRAEGEVAALGQALERYRLVHGDYPWIDSLQSNGRRELYAALIGNRSPTAGYVIADGRPVPRSSGDPLAQRKGEHFIDPGPFAVGDADEPAGEVEVVVDSAAGTVRSLDSEYRDHALIDPWGNPYFYAYRSLDGTAQRDFNWVRAGPMILSLGPGAPEGADPARFSFRAMFNGPPGRLAENWRSRVPGGLDMIVHGD